MRRTRPTCCDRLADLQPKVLLGSDFPTIPYPYAHQLEGFRGSISGTTGCGRCAGRTVRGSSV